MVAVAAVGKIQSLKSWEEVRRYENDELLFAFERKLKISRGEATELFLDLKRYLWLSALRITEYEAHLVPHPQLRIDDDLWLIDEAWHLFLQFSRDYQDFCQNQLGFFLHHEPVTERDREQSRLEHARDPEAFELKRRAEFKEMLSWIYDRAGADTVKRWFLTKEFSKPASTLSV